MTKLEVPSLTAGSNTFFSLSCLNTVVLYWLNTLEYKSLTLSAGHWKQVNVAKVRTSVDDRPVINEEKKKEDLNPRGSRKGDYVLKARD